MANKELVDYIKKEEARGYSIQQLRKTLLESKYKSEEVEEAFKFLNKDEEQKSFPFLAFTTLLLGFGVVSLLLTFLFILMISLLSIHITIGYFLIILFGITTGYYFYHVTNSLRIKDKLKAIIGIFSPVFSLVPIILLFRSIRLLQEELSSFAANGNSGAMGGIYHIFSQSIPHPYISAAIFYICCNVFIITKIVKDKKQQHLMWYLLAPTLIFLIWLVVEVVTKTIMKNTLGL
jgi:hypothetical protein